MGRMADLLRRAERARFDPYVAPAAVADVLPARNPQPEPEDEADSTIPFIEVGDVHAPAIRLVRAAEDAPAPPVVVPPPQPPAEPGFGGIFRIRFQPVHAGKVSGRGFAPELVAYHHPDHTVSVQYRSLVAEI